MILMFKILNDLIDVNFDHLFARCLGSARPHDLNVQMNYLQFKMQMGLMHTSDFANIVI